MSLARERPVLLYNSSMCRAESGSQEAEGRPGLPLQQAAGTYLPWEGGCTADGKVPAEKSFRSRAGFLDDRKLSKVACFLVVTSTKV